MRMLVVMVAVVVAAMISYGYGDRARELVCEQQAQGPSVLRTAYYNPRHMCWFQVEATDEEIVRWRRIDAWCPDHWAREE